MIADLLIEHEPDRFQNARPIFLVREKSDDLSHLPEALQALARFNGFSGETGVVLSAREGVLLGVGDGADPFACAAGAEKLPEDDYRIDGASAEQCFGWLLGAYRFDRYKSGKAAVARLIAPKDVDTAPARREARAVGYVRDLVNTPAADMGPDALEREARDLAKAFDAGIEIITGDDLLTHNFPLVHAVGRAAAVAPRLIDITWGRRDAPRVTLIGKGVTFDSGGLDIKRADGMALMKKDMGGAAHALALGRLVMEAKLDLRLRVIVPAVENAISANAFRPGDIIRSRKGLTVEIGNTDAEGRLVLADAMTLGGEADPHLMITLATLTGAARVALGPELPPFYCDDEKFAAAVIDASVKSFDPLWRMPLWKAYASSLSSPVADLNNAPGGSFAGSIIAALFLKRFAPERTLWGHFDIYAWRAKAAPGRPVGGEAQVIRALFRALKEHRFA
ncbi:MAG: leucyl aminopeptidase family protein [Parvularculaceae bacterium]|nr:leucyl aminopeptidase family protein [Parvularculaceae bacterium]